MSTKWYRLALSVVLSATVFWLWSTRYDELKYHTFATKKVIDIGDAVNFDTKTTSIPLNSYVSVSGILGNKAATITGLRAGSFRFGRYQVRHLLGSKLYIEYDEEKYHQDFSPFKNVAVKGRLTPLSPGSDLEKVREFFKSYYQRPIDDSAMLVVVDEIPKSQFRYPILFLISMLIILISIFSSIKIFFRRQ